MRKTPLLATFVVALALLVAMPAAGLVATDAAANETINETDEELNETDTPNATAPGEQLSGIMGMQKAELEGDIENRAFGLRLMMADSDEERADILSEQFHKHADRMETIEEQLAQLNESHNASEISPGQYRAQIAPMGPQLHSIESIANQSGQIASELPPHLLEERNISMEHIHELRQNASKMSGGEVAEMARGIGGPHAGHGPPHTSGGPPMMDHDNETERGPGHADNDTERGPPGDDDRERGPPGDDERQNDEDETEDGQTNSDHRTGNGR